MGAETKKGISRRQFLKGTLITSIGMVYLQFDLKEIVAKDNIHNSISQWPAVFYSPHQDDEAISMAGAIREHKDAGRPVYLVLLTDGINAGLLDIMNGSTYCKWHQTSHDFQLTMDQMCWARKVEFLASARRLGVDKVFILKDGQGLSDLIPYKNYNNFVRHIVQTIKHFETNFPSTSHKLVSGSYDLLPDGTTNPTHQACWDAAILLRNQISDFRFYRTYIYYKDKIDRVSQSQLSLKPNWQVSKRTSLDEYKLFNPDASRFAIGYHSVPSLIDAAYSDDTEYLDLLP